MDGESLKDVRIWLSGSIPDDSTAEEAGRISDFTRAFAREVFGRDARLVHGSHPKIREILLEEAESFKGPPGSKAGLALAVSRYFSKEPEKNGIDLERWNALCAERVIETPEAPPDPVTGQASRQNSLQILRDTLAEQCNAIVAVGGKWWKTAPALAGVPDEIGRARANGMPLFLLGGLGGATRDYLEQNPDLLRDCRNGLTIEENRGLAGLADPAELAKRVVDQTSRLPLRARTPASGRPFRILCLDGGGIRGVFTAAMLAYWEKALELDQPSRPRLVDHFDLIAGTSAGGILAIGLGLGMTASQMRDFYVAKGPTIFPIEEEIAALYHSFRHWFGAKFDQSVLKAQLEAAYARTSGAAPVLDRSLARLVIPTYDTRSDTPIVLRTPHGIAAAIHRGRQAVEVALETAAAPTYFDPLPIGHYLAVDGGVWANSPTTIALAEAISELRVEPRRVEMLSIGTTTTPTLQGQPLLLDRRMIETLLKLVMGSIPAKLPSFLWKPRRIQGKLGWVANIAGLLMKTQAQTAEYVCRGILGDQLLRADESVAKAELDDVSSIDRLITLAETVAQTKQPEVRRRFLNGIPADPWR